MPEKIVVITGPTGTGKTRLGAALALDLGGEIVSADSMQVYRRMDIGTAKATPAQMRGVPHHMIDIAEPSEPYSAARYVEQADACIGDILSRGRLPIVVGGTNLYIDSLISGRSFADSDSDGALRQLLSARYDELGGEALLEELRGFDPERAAKLRPSDKRRIVRAIEVYRLTGETITLHDEKTRALPKKYDAAVIALDFESREALYSRINARVDEMVDAGLFDEVHSLLPELAQNATAMQAIGYKEPAMFFRCEITKPEAVELIKLASRRYAKRQLTWLRRSEDVFWIRWGVSPDFCEARRLSTEFLHGFGL